MTIGVKCDGPLVSLKSLQPFQGTVKTLMADQYAKLRKSIERYGLRFPVFYWERDGVKYTLDGHQRVFVLEKMLEDGWELEGGLVPAVAVQADSEKEAKALILLATSQYAKMTPEGLYEFLTVNDVDFMGIAETVELPQIDMDSFRFGWMDDHPSTFDAARVDGVPDAENSHNFVIYFAFPDRTTWEEAVALLTNGSRKVSNSTKQVALAGPEYVERWRALLA